MSACVCESVTGEIIAGVPPVKATPKVAPHGSLHAEWAVLPLDEQIQTSGEMLAPSRSVSTRPSWPSHGKIQAITIKNAVRRSLAFPIRVRRKQQSRTTQRKREDRYRLGAGSDP